MMPVSSLHSRPIAYLVRVGSIDKSFPLLSDPPLSQSGIEQVSAVVQHFSTPGIGPIKAVMTSACMQFADLLSSAMIYDPSLPPVIICDVEVMNLVYPGGIVAVYQDGEEERYEAEMGEIPITEHN